MTTQVRTLNSPTDGVAKAGKQELNDFLNSETATFPTMPNFPVNTGYAAAGSTINDATPIPSGITPVTGADGTKGVFLTVGAPGAVFIVFNKSGSILKVYPPTVGTLNDGATGAALSMAAHTSAVIIALSSLELRSIPLLPS